MHALSLRCAVIHDLDYMHFNEMGVAHHMGELFGSGWRAVRAIRTRLTT